MNANWCKRDGFEDLIVSYIYDEATPRDRVVLETHILECTSCMEEFAGMSSSRLSVFEWQRESFADIATPAFTLPEAKPQRASIFEALQTLLGGYGGPALAFGALFVLIFGGVTFIYLSRQSVPDSQVADIRPAASPAKVADLVEEPAPARKREDLAHVNASVAERRSTVFEPAAVRTSPKPRGSRPGSQLMAKAEKRTAKPGAEKKAPVLSEIEDADDRSLMLSDLFDDEVGSIF